MVSKNSEFWQKAKRTVRNNVRTESLREELVEENIQMNKKEMSRTVQSTSTYGYRTYSMNSCGFFPLHYACTGSVGNAPRAISVPKELYKICTVTVSPCARSIMYRPGHRVLDLFFGKSNNRKNRIAQKFDILHDQSIFTKDLMARERRHAVSWSHQTLFNKSLEAFMQPSILDH